MTQYVMQIIALTLTSEIYVTVLTCEMTDSLNRLVLWKFCLNMTFNNCNHLNFRRSSCCNVKNKSKKSWRNFEY